VQEEGNQNTTKVKSPPDRIQPKKGREEERMLARKGDSHSFRKPEGSFQNFFEKKRGSGSTRGESGENGR